MVSIFLLRLSYLVFVIPYTLPSVNLFCFCWGWPCCFLSSTTCSFSDKQFSLEWWSWHKSWLILWVTVWGSQCHCCVTHSVSQPVTFAVSPELPQTIFWQFELFMAEFSPEAQNRVWDAPGCYLTSLEVRAGVCLLDVDTQSVQSSLPCWCSWNGEVVWVIRDYNEATWSLSL